MNKKNEKGFALVLSIILLLVMSLMGGALIVISAGDHQSNNTSDEYQQTFYVAETALLEGEQYLLNQFLGPWDISTHKRDTTKRVLPANQTSKYQGAMTKKNYSTKDSFYYNTGTQCFNSFPDINRTLFYVVAGESWNFGKVIRDSFDAQASIQEKKEAEKLRDYYYEYFVTRVGAATFRGHGSSVKKKASDSGSDGMAYTVYGCGIKSGKDRMVVALESTVILPK